MGRLARVRELLRSTPHKHTELAESPRGASRESPKTSRRARGVRRSFSRRAEISDRASWTMRSVSSIVDNEKCKQHSGQCEVSRPNRFGVPWGAGSTPASESGFQN